MKKTPKVKETLELLAKDFKNTNFVDSSNCAIAKAARRHFKKRFVSEGVDGVTVATSYEAWLDNKDKFYKHRSYGPTQFDRDMSKAAKVKFSKDVVIRKIVLTPR